MSVSVMGGVQEEFGIKTAMKVQRVHNGEVADALLNISGVGTRTGEPVHKDEPRIPYTHAEFPKMLYRSLPGEKGQLVVMHANEMKAALESGWREEPYPVLQVAVLDPAQEKKNLLDTNERLQSQLIQMQEQMDKMAKLVETAAAVDTAKRARGKE